MIKKTDKASIKTIGVSLEQFANETGVSHDRLRTQFTDAGMKIEKVDGVEVVSEEQKQQLLHYLQQHHGAKQNGAPEKIVLRRARTSEIKIGGSHGAAKTVSVQVRKKRTFIKRPQAEEEAKSKEEAQAPTAAPIEAAIAEAIASGAPGVAAPEVVGEATAVEAGAQVPETEATAAGIAAGIEAEVAAPPSEAGSAGATEATYVVEEEKAPETKTEAAKPGTPIKRKEKRVIEEEAEGERFKKKKRSREGLRAGNGDKNFEALLSRGANLSRVLMQDEEDLSDLASRKSARARHIIQGKIKVQAFTRPTAPIIHEVEIPDIINIGELASRMSIKASEVIKVLMKMGTMATINQTIDKDTAILVVEELGHKPRPVSGNALEEALAKATEVKGAAAARPPVITIMGHVDHGKTTLLDYIRTTRVAASEAGGITQHIGAYHVQTQKGTITFLDTPGHAAFTAMRARGAKLTDIVVLVVAADDGVMPQTIEAIQHAKAANVPIVVAVNKMDKQGVDPDRVKAELGKHGLIPEEWGGDTMFVPISAKTGMGVDALLDSLLVQAEVLELKAVIDCPARGVVIESRLDKGRGAVMSVLIQQGTLNKGDIVLAGNEYGKIRALFDENGKAINSAGPSIPVEILGLSGVAQAGDDFLVLNDEKRAREIAIARQAKTREAKFARQAPKLEDLLQRIEEEKATTATLNIILKADVQGSIEALKQALSELSGTEVKVSVISSGIGGISESDVNLAIASHAIIIGFNVRANVEARKLIEANNVDVHYHNIIYDVINQVKKAVSGALAPEIHEKIVGLAQVRNVFRSSKIGTIAGCMVIEGLVKRNFPIRVLRDNVVIFEGALESLRRFKEDVSEVRAGMECGIAVKNYNDVKVGDQIEVFEKIEIKREI